MTTTLPALRATITEIERDRNDALRLYGEAFDTLAQANARAHSAMGRHTPYNMPTIRGQYDRHTSYRTDERDAYLEERRKVIDAGVWTRLLDHMGLEKLMDAQAKEEFRKRLHDDPPPATAENCWATMQTLVEDSGTIFMRGLANAFSKLDRRFRSHDGFKIGSRMVLTWAFSEGGYMNSDREAVLRDVERVMCVLAGEPIPEDRSVGIIGAVEAARRGYGRGAFVAETSLLRVRAFKNGNAHVWFLRDDLVEKANQLLAEYYGATVGAGSDAVHEEAHDKAAMERRGSAVVRAGGDGLDFFATPDVVVEIMLGSIGHDAKRVLEPSAGTGAIARAVRKSGRTVKCIELSGERAAVLRELGFDVTQADFLTVPPPEGDDRFDAVIMNPPFGVGGSLAIDHVWHALKFLRPGGRLVAVMPASVEFREDRKSTAFRTLAAKMKPRWESGFHDLPPGSFAESGTNVNAFIVTMEAPADPRRAAENAQTWAAA